MSTQISMFWGTVTYEFRMQLHRRALWIVMVLLIGLIFYWQRESILALLFQLRGSRMHASLSPDEAIVSWADGINRLLPIAVGILLADRFPRDRQIKIDELLLTLPAGQSTRLLGKYVGSLCATLIPPTLYYCLGLGILLVQTHSLALLPTALLAFVCIFLPGMMFVGAFAIVCPMFLWWPIYCFCFTAYWFWGNLLSPRQNIPTISTTILTPLGGYMSQGFFGVPAYGPEIQATLLSGFASLSLLLGLTIMILLIGCGLLKWQRS
ncbi:hypothetical protein [Dictyobacter arantiisoli]|uniref:ABC transporter permease n=1 Tax=Dictyobacter arantiisoli TaxID=2014874 RepID=A0A5A5T695_9CHLR|nr:hypothetical protein [Dictyobacter arantiisoli]GCF06981.1 hypothetical protein KDI_05450 [Dictyobacter arantiisoli]